MQIIAPLVAIKLGMAHTPADSIRQSSGFLLCRMTMSLSSAMAMGERHWLALHTNKTEWTVVESGFSGTISPC